MNRQIGWADKSQVARTRCCQKAGQNDNFSPIDCRSSYVPAHTCLAGSIYDGRPDDGLEAWCRQCQRYEISPFLRRHLERGLRHARGQLQLDQQRPFYRVGRSSFVRRRRQGHGRHQLCRQSVGSNIGRSVVGELQRPARRQYRRRPVERDHYRRPLQRHLAGHAKLVSIVVVLTKAGTRTPCSIVKVRAKPFLQWTSAVMGPRVRGDEKLRNRPNQRGAKTITTWRPSKRASCSTLANSATSLLTLSRSLVPISWCAISRPR